MSRIGNKPIAIPAGVEVKIDGCNVTVKGPKGTLTRKFSPLMAIEINENVLTVKRPDEEKHTKQLHGTTRALIATMIEGVSKGYAKTLKIVGIGYRAALAGSKLTLNGDCSKWSGDIITRLTSLFRKDWKSRYRMPIPSRSAVSTSSLSVSSLLLSDPLRSLNLTMERVSSMMENISAVRKARQLRLRSKGRREIYAE